MTSPVNRILNASLYFAPTLYLIADVLYAARGWDDPGAAVVHVLASIAYTFVMLWVVQRSTGYPAAVLLVAGAIGVAGSVAYGFDTIHVSLGDTALVDAVGAAVLIKPLGLCFPLMLLLCALALRRYGPGWAVASIAVASLAWPVAHIANLAWLAVAVNVALVAGFAGVAARRPAPHRSVDQPDRVATGADRAR
ncbi:hypothetical protein BJY16_005115 [Actinoplanes octamycinicus]|uniref:Uncharacterized protein n=1 Tax=Actinoplanes octamycinicus TaxID=135948 RepID=A0A7W7H0E1_9ACTN|nr:hypothetical protein [Actinoplanes octamycinicus]MBB4741656.1 hypothetical protein [Actinoplanes octamycinicus]GIE57209.1 hypothetical protein Aoc01nite_26110 [Actinoplanes octamycinicus]